MVQSIIFALVTLAAFGLAARQYWRVRRNILLGMDEPLEGPASQRWRNMLLVAFGQKKMFKNWIAALLHLFIYTAFLITQVELIEILYDGLTGHHRAFAQALGGFYTFVISFIEVLSLLALVATVAFLWRRNVLKLPRFHKPEMKGWPFRDANLILWGEILLIIGIFCMNGADKVLQSMGAAGYHETGAFVVSSWLGPALFGGLEQGTLVVIERFGWWLHILVVYAFLNYLPISKHLHILLAFPNTFYARLTPRGQLRPMPEVQREVAAMLNPEAAAGRATGRGERARLRRQRRLPPELARPVGRLHLYRMRPLHGRMPRQHHGQKTVAP
ncbi:MAG: hypothetical protein KatS3mg029_0444 [Saprospiraceae bacterium]|nr:MAG: hypothetical protein KatS3mg029_0444 [Saprospiraceae bacterium]